jgi:hypothetical protein
MPSLIDRKQVLDAIEQFYRIHVNSVADAIRDMIVEVPTIEAEPVRHGHWIYKGGEEFACSLCDARFVVNDDMVTIDDVRYCYQCGAKMTEGDTDGT